MVLVLKVQLLQGLDTLLTLLSRQVKFDAVLEFIVVDIIELMLLLRHFPGGHLRRRLDLVITRGILVLHFLAHYPLILQSKSCLVSIDTLECGVLPLQVLCPVQNDRVSLVILDGL